MDPHPAAAYNVPDEGEIVDQAVMTVLESMSPKQFLRLAQRIKEVCDNDFGELHLLIRGGRIDVIQGGPADKMSQFFR